MNTISVIVPVYNSEKYLKTCLNSIINQSYHNLEIILIDDGSKDQSGAICDYYADSDQRIHVIHKLNEGVSIARNTGLKTATGQWFSFVDSDDELENDMYEFLLSAQEKSKAQIVHCGYKRVDDSGKIIKEVSGSHQMILQNSEEAIECMLAGHLFSGGLWNKLYSRNVIDGLSFDETLTNNEDILFNALAFQKAEVIEFVDETKYRYCVHSSSACNSIKYDTKIRNAVQASRILITKSQNNRVRFLAEKRLFSMQSNLYRYLIFSRENTKDETGKLRKWLIDNYKPDRMSIREKLNFILMVYFKWAYKIVYRIYDLLRKPNWDAS